MDIKKRTSKSFRGENSKNQHKKASHSSSNSTSKSFRLRSLFPSVKNSEGGFPWRWVLIGIGILFLLGGIIGGGGAWYYYQQTEIVSTSGGQLREGIVGQPDQINPIFIDSSQLQEPSVDRTLSTLLYPHLFRINEQGELEEDLITKHTLNQDKTTYTLSLAQNRYWQDDKPITATDVVYTIEQIQNSNLNSPLQPRFEDVEVEKIGEYELTLSIPEPYSPFIYNLNIGILPHHIWSDYTDEEFSEAQENITPVAGGDFYVENLIKSEEEEQNRITSYILTPRENLQEEINIDQLAIQLYANNQELITAFQEQEIHSMSSTNALEETPKIQKHTINIPQYFGLFFNTKSDLFNDNPELMQAMRARLDKQELNTIISQGQALPVDGPLTPMNTFYTPTEETSSRGEAEQILSQNGWSLNDERNLKKDETVAKFTVRTSQDPEIQELMEFLRDQFSDIGIEMTVKKHTFQELSQTYISERDYDALFIGTALRTYPDPYLYWHSSQVPYPGFNLSQYSNANLDELLEEARTTHDQERIEENMQEFQDIIRTENPAIFLYSPQFIYYTQDPLTGVSLNQGESAAGRFHTLPEWQVNTKRQFPQ